MTEIKTLRESSLDLLLPYSEEENMPAVKGLWKLFSCIQVRAIKLYILLLFLCFCDIANLGVFAPMPWLSYYYRTTKTCEACIKFAKINYGPTQRPSSPCLMCFSCFFCWICFYKSRTIALYMMLLTTFS